jgi:IS1 family transposase
METMNQLTTARRTQIVSALVEGNSIRSTSRMTGAAKGTILKLLPELGEACWRFHDQTVRGLRCPRIQCDEIWSFCYAKDRNLPDSMRGQPGVGDIWTWTAIDVASRFVISWHAADRSRTSAQAFLLDLAGRICTERPNLVTDGHKPYYLAVPAVFGEELDFAMLVKQYDTSGRYKGAIRKQIIGQMPERQVSTSYVERQNLSMRMGMRRFTRKTNAFSKKMANLRHALSLYFVHYNFARVHQTLRVTPAMEVGLANHVWTLEDIVGLLEPKPSN